MPSYVVRDRSKPKRFYRRLPESATTVMLTYLGRTMSVSQWCHEVPGLKAPTILARHERGWNDAQALGFEAPPERPHQITSITYNGERHSLQQWAFRTGVEPMTIKFRITFGGWTTGQALGFDPPPTPQRGPLPKHQ